MINIRLSQEDKELFKSYAKFNNISVSELVRQSVLERIEDEYDLQMYREAMELYKKDPKTYTHEEVLEALGLE